MVRAEVKKRYTDFPTSKKERKLPRDCNNVCAEVMCLAGCDSELLLRPEAQRRPDAIAEDFYVLTRTVSGTLVANFIG